MAECEVLTLCSGVVGDLSKPSLAEVLSVLEPPSLPADANVVMFARVRFDVGDEGRRTLDWVVSDPDGQETKFFVDDSDWKVVGDHAFAFKLFFQSRMIPLSSYGDYKLSLLLDGMSFTDIMLRVRRPAVA